VSVVNKAVEDHLWVTREELKEYFSPDYLAQMANLAFE